MAPTTTTVTVLTDGLGYQADTYTDRRNRQRRRMLRAGRGDTVELDAEQADRFRRLGAVGSEDDLEAVRFLDTVRASRTAERARVYRMLADGDADSLHAATLDVFGIDDDTLEEVATEADDPAEAARTMRAAELDTVKAPDLRAQAAAMGIEGITTKTAKADVIAAIVAVELDDADPATVVNGPADDAGDEEPPGDDEAATDDDAADEEPPADDAGQQ